MNLLKTLLLAALLALAPLAGLAADLIDINAADAETLQQLNGIGAKKAQTIIEYRQEHGPFATVDDLVNVKGIGAKTLEKNRDQMTVGKGAKPQTGGAQKSEQDKATK